MLRSRRIPLQAASPSPQCAACLVRQATALAGAQVCSDAHNRLLTSLLCLLA